MAQPVAETGVVPIGGAQSNIVITAATAIVPPTTAQRAQVGTAAATEFKKLSMGTLVMWLTVEGQDARFNTDGSNPTTAIGLLIKAPTTSPLVFVGERMIRALVFISVIAAGTISYRFFFKDNT